MCRLPKFVYHHNIIINNNKCIVIELQITIMISKENYKMPPLMLFVRSGCGEIVMSISLKREVQLLND